MKELGKQTDLLEARMKQVHYLPNDARYASHRSTRVTEDCDPKKLVEMAQTLANTLRIRLAA